MSQPSTVHLQPQADCRATNMLESRAQECLLQSGRRALCQITCQCSQLGILRLSGEVPTYFLKQMAQETVRRVDGVQGIVNHLYVHSGEN